MVSFEFHGVTGRSGEEAGFAYVNPFAWSVDDDTADLGDQRGQERLGWLDRYAVDRVTHHVVGVDAVEQ